MRFQIQMWYLGAWQYMDAAGSHRLADLLAVGLQKAWANFGANVRVIDIDTGAIFKAGECA